MKLLFHAEKDFKKQFKEGNFLENEMEGGEK